MGSGIKTFTAGDVLTDADLNNYLMRQSVVTCTSGTRPSSPTTGQPIYETDTKLIRVWDGSTWHCPASPDYASYSPTFYHNALAGNTIGSGNYTLSYARYQKVNKRVHFYGHVTIAITTAGGFGIGLPFNTSQRIFGMGQVYLLGSTSDYAGQNAVGNAVTPAISAPYNRIVVTADTNGLRNITTAGDAVAWNIVYECE